jgi:uncharacterized protein
MLPSGLALKVTLHLNSDTSNKDAFLHQDILQFLQRSGIAGATVLHAHAGFGSHHQLHTEGAGPVAGEHLPILISFIDVEERVRAVLPELLAMVSDGLVEMHPVEILKFAATTPKVVS